MEILLRRKNQGQYNYRSLIPFAGPLTKNNPHALRSSWPWIASLEGQRGSPAVHALGLPVGDIPPMGTLLGPCVTVPTPSPLQKRTTSNTKRVHARASPPLGTNRPDAGTCGRTLNIVRTSRIRAGPFPPRGRRWARGLRRPPSRQCPDSPHHMTTPTSDRVSYWDMSNSCAVVPLLSPDKPTDEDIRIEMSVRCAHDLGSGSSSGHRREWARRFCIGRDLGDGFVHDGLNGRSYHT